MWNSETVIEILYPRLVSELIYSQSNRDIKLLKLHTMKPRLKWRINQTLVEI